MQLTPDDERGPAPLKSPTGAIARQVAANASLLVAVLVYMGWAEEDAYFGYFHVRPLDLDVGIVEYMLRSLTLFSLGLVIATVAVIAGATALALSRDSRWLPRRVSARMLAAPLLRSWLIADSRAKLAAGVGAIVTATAFVLAWRISRTSVGTYVVLGLLAGGPLIMTWPARHEGRGRFPYSLALIVTAVCALWAASVYAHDVGIGEAQAFVRNLPSRTAVAVYSIQRLALSGPGVSDEPLPDGNLYHHRYQGLRLLTFRSGTYYVVPVGWNQQFDLTYVLNESGEIRIELLSGVQRSAR